MLLVKTFHIVLIAAWFAGLFYLPRIFVNLAMETEPAATARLLTMARKLYRFMTFIAFPALACGLWLWLVIGIGRGQGWMHAKLTVVVLLIGYHFYCGRLLARIAARTSGIGCSMNCRCWGCWRRWRSLLSSRFNK
jgi:putative membrane protein